MKKNNIEYSVIDDINKHILELSTLILNGGQWVSLDNVKNMVRKGHLIIIATIQDKIVGTYVLRNKIQKNGITYCTGGLLSVDTNYRNQHIGYNIVQYTTELLEKSGIDLVIATIKPNNIPSIKTFKKSGYSYWNDIHYTSDFFEHRYFITSKDVKKEDLTLIMGRKN